MQYSVLIPLIGFKSINKTIESVLLQEYSECEILILRNDIDIEDIPGRLEVYEKDIPAVKRNVLIREVLIHQKGKGNALNIGAKKAKYDLLCVLDADCILDRSAFAKIANDFTDTDVIAVGGRLIATSEKRNLLTFLQQIEYEKTFNIFRNLFNLLDANCLISGAFGVFRKKEFASVNGYDTDTVGEDMELILRLQKIMKPTGKRIIYDKDSICYTGTPFDLHRLLKQRDRWQRGLLDCLIKHRKMIGNPKYGLLGIVALPYQAIFELLGSIFILGQLFILAFIIVGFEPFFGFIDLLDFLDILGTIDRCSLFHIYGLIFGFETVLTCIAECKEQKTIVVTRKIIIRAIASTILGTIMSIPLAVARIFGMMSFHWRRLKW